MNTDNNIDSFDEYLQRAKDETAAINKAKDAAIEDAVLKYVSIMPDLMDRLSKLPADLRSLVKKYIAKGYSFAEALDLAKRELEQELEEEPER